MFESSSDLFENEIDLFDIEQTNIEQLELNKYVK